MCQWKVNFIVSGQGNHVFYHDCQFTFLRGNIIFYYYFSLYLTEDSVEMGKQEEGHDLDKDDHRPNSNQGC